MTAATLLPLAYFALLIVVLAFVIRLTTSRRIARATEYHAAAIAFAAQLGADAAHFCRLFDCGSFRQIEQDFPDFAEFRRERAVWLED